jgi:transcriptional regulator with XRE-family HTH domain
MDLSQQTLATRSGLTKSYVSLIESTGRRRLSKEAATKLAEVLNIQPDALEAGSGNTYTEIGERLNLDEFTSRIANSTTVRIMHTFFPELAKIKQHLVSALKKGKKVQVLILNPSSPINKYRSSDIKLLRAGENETPRDAYVIDPKDRDKDYISIGVDANIEILQTIYTESFEEREDKRLYPPLLFLRCYGEPDADKTIAMLPGMSMFQADDYISVGWYMHGNYSELGPQIVMRDKDHPLYRAFVDEFTTVWDASTAREFQQPSSAATHAHDLPGVPPGSEEATDTPG